MPRRTEKAAASTKSTRDATSADAVQLLTQDHCKVEALFKDFTTAGRKEEVARQIFKELEVHATLEEEIFYPALRSEGDLEELGSLAQGESEIGGINGANIMDEAEIVDDDEDDDEEDDAGEETGGDVIDSGYEDHQAVKELIGRLKSLSPESPDFQAGMAELQDMVLEHVAEEEDVLFPEAKLTLDTKTLGKRMQDRKQDLVSSLSQST